MVIVFGAGHVLGTKSYMGYTEDTAMLDLAQRKAEYAKLYGQETSVMYVTEIASYQGIEDFIRNAKAELCSLEHSNADDSINEEPNEPNRVVVYRTVLNEGDGCCKDIGIACAEILQTILAPIQHRTNSKGEDYFGAIKRAMNGGCYDAWLIEHGFHTNSACRAKLSDPEIRQLLAEKEVDAMAKYYGWTKAEPEDDVMLYKGCPSGEPVMDWQNSLLEAGFKMINNGKEYPADGSFGTATVNGTNDFKASVGLPKDGKVDSLTYGLMLRNHRTRIDTSEKSLAEEQAKVASLIVANDALEKKIDEALAILS